MMNVANPITRRSFLRKTLYAGAAFLAAGGFTSAYAFQIEPRWIEIKRIRLSFERLPEAFHGIKVVHFSDVHIGQHFNLEHLHVVSDLINKQQPDLLCFTGDLFDFTVSEDAVSTGEMLAKLQAPLGKWAVLGNHDYYTGAKETTAILQKGNFATLVNQHARIRLGEAELQIAGVDDITRGKPNIKAALNGADPNQFTLLLSHSANYADEAVKEHVDLQLSGHSHGGQVRLPFLGAPVTPPNGDKYVMGHYVVQDSRLQVYTNRGIGTSILPVRFMCRPEITVITLERRKS